MKYTFFKDEKEIGTQIAPTLREAEVAQGVSVGEATGVSYTASEEDKKTGGRKPRADKGTTRKTLAKEKTRKKPEYFLFNGAGLTPAMSRADTLKALEVAIAEENYRVIVGHEIKFSRQVTFHNM